LTSGEAALFQGDGCSDHQHNQQKSAKRYHSSIPLQFSFSPMRRFLTRVRLRRGIVDAFAEPIPNGEFGEKLTAAALANDAKQVRSGPPIVRATLCAWQARLVFDGIAQRHKRLALAWYWYRLEKL
jgi:hypothetical protein